MKHVRHIPAFHSGVNNAGTYYRFPKQNIDKQEKGMENIIDQNPNRGGGMVEFNFFFLFITFF